ncbi:hypothetical protein Q7P35_007420 [Cladosporium inversicolor]
MNALTPEPDPIVSIEDTLSRESLQDENVQSVMHVIDQKKTRHPFLQLAQCVVREGLLYYRDKIYVPESEDLRARILRQHYDNPSAGHLGRAKTFELLSRSYYWKGMNTDTRCYDENCRICGRTKPRHDRH